MSEIAHTKGALTWWLDKSLATPTLHIWTSIFFGGGGSFFKEGGVTNTSFLFTNAPHP